MTMKNFLTPIQSLSSIQSVPIRSVALLIFAIVLGACSPQASEQELLDRARQAMTEGNDRAAEIDVKTALQLNPGNASARKLLGEVYLFQQNPAVAAEELERALAGAEDNESRVLLARALLESGRSDQLIESHGRGDFAGVQDNAQIQVILAQAMAGNGELQQARALVDEALASAPDDPMVTTTHALFQVAYSNAPDQARATLERTVEAHPDHANAWSLLGGVQRLSGDFAEAEISYARAVELNPYLFADRLNLVRARMDQGKTEEARSDLQRLLAGNRDHPGVNYLQGRLLVETGDYEAALAALFNVLNVMPDHAGSLYLSAVANINEGNLATAQGQLDRLLADQPGNIEAQLLQANLYMRQGDPVSAEEVARSVLQFDATNYPAIVALASALEAQGQSVAENIELYESMVEVSPDAPEARMALGIALLQSGDSTGGIEQFRTARDLAPQLAQPRELLIQAHLTAGDIESALGEAEDYAEQLPDNPGPDIIMARVAVQQNDLETARAHFADAEEKLRQLLVDQSDDIGMQALLADVLAAQGKLDEAGTVLAELPEEIANRPSMLVVRGRLALSASRAGEAESLLRDALEASPDSMTVLLLSRAIAAQDRQEEIIGLFENWLEDYPADMLVRNELAAANLRQGREQEALSLYQEVVEENPDDVIVLNNTAWFLRESDPQQALVYIERANELVPNNPQLLDTYAMVKLELDAVDEALSLNQRAVDMVPADVGIRINRAVILNADGQTAEALSLLNEIVNDDSIEETQRQAARNKLTELQ